jgi:hypothetical protein
MDHGTPLTQVAKEFMTGQPEFDALYGVNPTNASFVNQLYHNVLHRDADADGFNYWVNVLNSSGDKTEARAQMLIGFSDSAENQALVIGSLQHGLAYTPYG